MTTTTRPSRGSCSSGRTREAAGKTIALTKQKGRVDTPSIAASGDRVFITWIDANTGQVRVARSSDGGKSWIRSVIGKTTALSPDNDGMRGSATIGAAGNAVGVAWVANASGAIKARVSTNGGKRWHDAISVVGSLGAANGGTPSLRGWGNKLALAWTTPGGVFSRVWAKSWGPVHKVASFAAGAAYKGGFDVEVVTSPGDTLGAVWSACRTAGCDLLSARTRIDVLWSDSGGGATWSAPSLVQGSVHADQRINDAPAAVWLDGDTPVVVYTSRAAGWTTYGVFARVGS